MFAEIEPVAAPCESVLAECVCAGTIKSLLPPVCVADPVIAVFATPESSALAAITNLFRKSGVPLFPSHRYHPAGMLAIDPDHITITPVGIMSRTNAVVAILVESSLAAGVLDVGEPVSAALETSENVSVELSTFPKEIQASLSPFRSLRTAGDALVSTQIW
jgi:hypothetical protein